MGLIKAALGSAGGVLADQWREYFYCDSLSENVLVAKGVKRQTSRGSNTKGSDNVITNGSVIVVNEGQCMMIVDQGAIVEFTAEAGEFTWNSSSEPSIFYGGLGQGLSKSWETFKRRFTFAGEPAKDQRIYYFNLKELPGNKYGTPAPFPSGWWIRTSAWTWTFPSGATASILIRSPTPCCSTRTSAATCPTATPVKNWTAS